MKKKNDIQVLIVDDDYRIREIITELLHYTGYSVISEASNGKEAILSVETVKPDVILMDIRMPEMDGIKATEEIFKRNPTPVVALTGYESKEILHKASLAGVGAYLVKPPDIKEIDRAITIAIARFNDMMELRRLNNGLKEAMEQVKTLKGLLPICAHCKKIRDDQGYWNQVEVYIKRHSEAEFSHGICPDCVAKIYS